MASVVSPTPCQVIYDVTRFGEPQATTCTPPRQTAYRYRSISGVRPEVSSMTSHQVPVGCRRHTRTFAEKSSQKSTVDTRAKIAARHAAPSANNDSVLRSGSPCRLPTVPSSASAGTLPVYDNRWPYIVEFLIGEHTYKICEDIGATKMRWDDVTRTWIAEPSNRLTGLYLKFVTGMSLDNRLCTDHQGSSGNTLSRRYCKRFELHMTKDGLQTDNDNSTDYKARRLEELRRMRSERLQRLLEHRSKLGTNNGSTQENTLNQTNEDQRQLAACRDGYGVDGVALNDDEDNTAMNNADKGDRVGGETPDSGVAGSILSNRNSSARQRLRDVISDVTNNMSSSDRGGTGEHGGRTFDNERGITSSSTEYDYTTKNATADSGFWSGLSVNDDSRMASFVTERDDGDNDDEQTKQQQTADRHVGFSDETGGCDNDDAARQRQGIRRRPVKGPSSILRRVAADDNDPRFGHQRRRPGWFDNEDFSSQLPAKHKQPPTTEPDVDVQPESDESSSSLRRISSPSQRPSLQSHICSAPKHSILDDVFAERIERHRLAARQRRRAYHMPDKYRRRSSQKSDTIDTEDTCFDDYDWLSKYCILDKNKVQHYKLTFDEVDEEDRGHLDAINTIIALRAVNPQLTDADEQYIYTIMELTGYRIADGTDHRLFAVLAALSHRITSLEDWMKGILRSFSCRALASKLFMCKTLWECCVDEETKTIPIDHLCVELRAGGVNEEHEQEVRTKLGPPRPPLDLLDFLAYIPLFIMIHTSVVDHPLNDTRDK